MKNEIRTEFNYDQITDQIFVGADPSNDNDFLQEFKDKGVAHRISLHDSDIGTEDINKSTLHLLVKQGSAPSQEQLLATSKVIKSIMDNNEKVYIHCKYGIGRAPTLAAAYLIYNGYTVDEAVELLHKKRRGTHILNNQQKALKEFEKSIRKQG